MKVNAIIPAKGNSSRFEKKNLQKINTKSLTYIACEKCLDCANIDHVYLDTDSQEIIDDVRPLMEKGLKILERPEHLRTEIPGNNRINELLLFALQNTEPCDLILHVHVTSPLLSINTLENSINTFIASENYDSFFTAIHFKDYLWTPNAEPVNFDSKGPLLNCADLPKYWLETHGVYGILSSALLSLKRRVGDRPLPVEVPEIESIDINNHLDFEYLKLVIEKEGINI